MNIPRSEQIPPEEQNESESRRRRRKRRQILPEDAGEQAAFLEELAQQVIPRFDFLIFSLISGLIAGIAVLSDSLAVFVLAALVAPLLAPAMGLALAAVTGSIRFFSQVLGGFLFGCLLVFSGGALVGWIARLWSPFTIQNALEIAQFSWTDLAILFLGTIFTTGLILRSNLQLASVASVALAFEIYLPLGVAGFGLTNGSPGIWPEGMFLFFMHIAWSAVVGIFTLAGYGLRPRNMIGYGLGITLLLIASAALVAASLTGDGISGGIARITRTPTPTVTLPATSTVPATDTPVPPTATRTPTRTDAPTGTPTLTLSPQPTAVFAKISAGGQGGFVRQDPDFDSPVVVSLLDETIVKVLPETEIQGNTTWVRIRTIDGKEGWIVQSLLVTATPAPE